MQPKVGVLDGRVVGVEGVLGRRQETGSVVAPADFIPFAERSGSVIPITWFVFDCVASVAGQWRGLPQGFTVAVNVSSQVLDHPEFRSRLAVVKRRLASDDFGKGYSSLTYLKEIPATEIKIDKQFIGSVASDSKDLHIVKATIELAHAFGMQVVAEGVDNDQSLRVLAELGCEFAQGFYIARPMRAELVVDWVHKYTSGTTSKLLPNISTLLAAS